jgi:hypothetical protein
VLAAAKDQRFSHPELEGEYQRSWRALGHAAAPPSTVILVVGRTSDGELDIHDRWWFCGDKGLEFGCSFGGIGREKLSTIRELGQEQTIKLSKEMDGYFSLQRRLLKGERISYATINL